MNTPIRRFGVVLLALYVVLFVQLNWLHVFKADEYSEHPANSRAIIRDFSRPRGVIQTSDGVVVARSVLVPDATFERLREYPEGGRYAHLTGFFSFTFGTDGVEKVYNDQLTGRASEVGLRSFGDLFLDRRPTANVTLTVADSVQRAAAEALGERRGAVVALDPRTGAVLALYSWPTYDPNPLAAHDQTAVQAAREALLADPTKPLVARAFRERYFPGSTFKVVTATAALENGVVTPTEPVYPRLSALDLPTTNRPLRNFGGSVCGGDLLEALRVSCNTSFGQMGLDVGAQALFEQSLDFGFLDVPPLDLPAVAASNFPDPAGFERDLPGVAQAAIGQNDVQATPLQMALVAAAVANGGLIMTPHVMLEIRDDEAEVIEATRARPWRTAMSAGTADVLRQGMVAAVASGTGTRMQVSGVTVAGKTGTAELGGERAGSHAWIIGFAPAEAPRVAIAVFVEGDESTGTQTGGRVAAPIGKAVLEAALALEPAAAPGSEAP